MGVVDLVSSSELLGIVPSLGTSGSSGIEGNVEASGSFGNVYANDRLLVSTGLVCISRVYSKALRSPDLYSSMAKCCD